jgi:RHS repeat-associated protein
MYSPPLGRFLSRDPLPQNGEPEILYDNDWFGDRLTMMRNLYGYVDNNPVKNLDPSGLHTLADCWNWWNLCADAAFDQYQTCLKQGAWKPWACQVKWWNDLVGCDASYATCTASADETLYAAATCVVVAGAAALSQLDSPVPGPADAAAAGILGWWFAVPK